MARGTTVDDVFNELLGRIESGALALGAKLPSCRALADELKSNPTTVNRALGRLADAGLVRVETRRGTFVAATEPSAPAALAQIKDLARQAVQRARSAGISRTQLAAVFTEALEDPAPDARIAFVECNDTDLEEMAERVEHATGLHLERMHLHELSKKVALRFDAIATPIFHLSDVYALVGDLNRVIELNFVPTAASLRQIASVDPELTLGVATPLPRGVDRLTSLARQYFAGEVRGIHTGNGPVDLDGIDVLLVTAATELTDEDRRRVPRMITIEWELEYNSGATFERRVRDVLTATSR